MKTVIIISEVVLMLGIGALAFRILSGKEVEPLTLIEKRLTEFFEHDQELKTDTTEKIVIESSRSAEEIIPPVENKQPNTDMPESSESAETEETSESGEKKESTESSKER